MSTFYRPKITRKGSPLSKNDSAGYKNVTLKRIRAASNFPAYSISFSSRNTTEFFWSLFLNDCIEVQEKKRKSLGAIHSTKISENFGPKLNGSVPSNRKSFEKTGPPFEVVLFSRSDRSEFWFNGSRPLS